MKKSSEKQKRKKITSKKKIYPEILEVSEGFLQNTVTDKTKSWDYDAETLSQAKTYWVFGEWNKLVSIDINTLQNNPNRDRIALLIASGYQQLNHLDQTKKFIRTALDWGCSPNLIARILISGVHNTLARASAIKLDDTNTQLHFNESIKMTINNNKEAEIGIRARSIKELTRLGLLPQATSLLKNELQRTQNIIRPHLQAKSIRILQSEIELLNHELSLSLQRQQLYKPNIIIDKSETTHTRTKKTAELKKQSVSQLGQDLWVLEKTNYKKQGYFVEFGATDGVLLSNTFLLEKKYDWQGLCAEPNPKMFEKLKNNRNCITTNACIGSATGQTVEFILADAFGTISDFYNHDKHYNKRLLYKEANRTINIKTISLHDFLVKYSAPQTIDYLSIDTEGSEYDIIKTFPLDKWRIHLITIEHNFTKYRGKIRELLQSYGYNYIEMKWEDWFFLG